MCEKIIFNLNLNFDFRCGVGSNANLTFRAPGNTRMTLCNILVRKEDVSCLISRQSLANFQLHSDKNSHSQVIISI